MPKFTPRLSLGQIKALADRYRYFPDLVPVEAMVPKVRERGHFTKAELLAIGQWKSPRAVPKLAKNEEPLIADATRMAFATCNECLRIGVLTLLHGVGYPMASVMLHWCHSDRYPIIDYRALWSLGVDEPPAYTFDFWWSYTQFCRQLADEAKLDMRTLDKALWQYSWEKQPPKASPITPGRKFDRHVSRIIRDIKTMPVEAMQSGDDSPMRNVWEEWLVQMQGEHSIGYDAYEESIRALCRSLAAKLPESDQRVLWPQTEAYFKWDDEKEVPNGDILLDALENELFQRVCSLATDARLPARLARYLDRSEN